MAMMRWSPHWRYINVGRWVRLKHWPDRVKGHTAVWVRSSGRRDDGQDP